MVLAVSDGPVWPLLSGFVMLPTIGVCCCCRRQPFAMGTFPKQSCQGPRGSSISAEAMMPSGIGILQDSGRL